LDPNVADADGKGQFGKRVGGSSAGAPGKSFSGSSRVQAGASPELAPGETRAKRKWPRWRIILLSVLGVIFLGCYLFTRTVGPARLGADIVYSCKDTSGIHAVGLTWYYHITLKPAKISEKILLHQYIGDAEIRWDGDAVGHHFSGHIDRSTGAWEERLDNEVDKSGTCERIY
jgi:hypothetical protein